MFFSGSSTQTKANEVLSEPPSLFEENEKLNLNYINQFSDYFDGQYGLRNLMITLDHQLTAAIFGESAENKVILGKDGWLFYEETLDDFEGTNVMSERDVYATAKVISLIDEYYSKKGIDFAFTVAPNKNSLYPDKMPGYYPKNRGVSNAKLIHKALTQTDVKDIDLFEAFKNEDKPLYRKTDSHWTFEGAGLASDTILKALGKKFAPYYGSETNEKKAETADLYEMLYPVGVNSDTETEYTRKFNYTYERPIRSVEDNFIRTASESGNGNLFMFRDSFGNSLYHFMAGEFSRAVFCRLMPYNLTLAENEKADTVVIEIVERNIEWLISKGVIFPAPERNINLSETKNITSDSELSMSESDELINYIRIEGTIQNSSPETKTDIYIETNGKIYEATPGDNGRFYAYVPTVENTEQVSVFTK